MAPITALLPLITAGVGAAGGITAAALSRKKAPAPSSNSPLATSNPLSDGPNRRNGILPISTSPLGDTTNPNLQRGKLLGN